MTATRTTCPYCGVGCGVLATPGVAGEPHGVRIEGDRAHPANAGRLCVKGAALGETVGLEERLLRPEVREGSGVRRELPWDEALDRAAGGFRRIIDAHGPEAVAFYVSGQLLTEDYYVANKLMKGYIGTANIDTNSRLCMSSAVAGHQRAFGEDLVPVVYEDIDAAELILLVGSNTAWCHPILYQRIERAKQANPRLRVVVIDPRRTASCDIADLHLPVAAGSDVWLFNGLLAHLHEHGVVDSDFLAAHTRGLDETLAAAARDGGIRQVARACGLEVGQLTAFYRLFARHERTLSLFSQGVNQSSAGTDKVNAIINCHLLTGRIGRPGMGPFSVTGQPNAMGGREVGGLANTLAAHLSLGDEAHARIVQNFWASPTIARRPGLKAVELFEAMHAGRIKAVWIMATNPVVSLPDADRAAEALARCELVVQSDISAATDTARYAHIRLPALGWGEKDGSVTNSDRTISRQRAFLPPPGEARPDWWIISQVARRMGFAGFDYGGPAAIFDEHARLSATGNAGATRRAFNIGALASMSAGEYERLAPVRWPVTAESPAGTDRLFTDGTFFHPHGRARLVPVTPRRKGKKVGADYPLVLNTGRLRDQWHTMTRTGKASRLAGHRPEPGVEMNAYDALLAGVQNGELVRVQSAWGAMVARLACSPDQPRGQVFVPIHWNAQYASDARVGALVNPAVDPVSGEPEFKHTPVRVEPFPVDWHGFVLSRRALDLGATTYWVRVTGRQFTRYELAGRGAIAEHGHWAREWLGLRPEAALLEYSDPTAGLYRAALVAGQRIEACVFVSPRPDLPSRAWLAGLFAKPRLADIDRASLLLGEPIDRSADTGPTVCACFGVGRHTLRRAIDGGLDSVEALGEKLKAGTNCGSCVPELRALLKAGPE